MPGNAQRNKKNCKNGKNMDFTGKSPEEVFELGMEEAVYQGVCLIEWPEKMGAYLPKNIFKIEIENFGTGRKITINSSDEQKQRRLTALEC